MWEIALGVVGYLSRALGRSRERPERLFRDHVVPIQEDLLMVQQDYTRRFAELAVMIEDESIPTEDIAAHVERHRRKFNPVRIATGELAKALNELFAYRFQKKAPAEGSAEWLLHEYADAVIDYLYGHFDRSESDPPECEDVTVEEIETTMGTRFSSFMKVVRAVKDESCERARLAEIVKNVEGELERSWVVLAHRYGVLKARCLL